MSTPSILEVVFVGYDLVQCGFSLFPSRVPFESSLFFPVGWGNWLTALSELLRPHLFFSAPTLLRPSS